jgi:enoyl-CoA hydratase/carnithine racemase
VSTTGPVRLERDGELAVLSFDSPPLNLFDQAMAAAIVDAFDAVESEPPRALLIRAEGRVFSAGVDVSMFAQQSGSGSATGLVAGMLEISQRLEDLPFPTVFAAHALCLTWAFELALACDLIVAAESAKFGLVEKVVGLTPFMGGTQRLAERAGSGRARELVMTGTPYPAAVLERWNVVNRVLPDDADFDAAVRALATELAAGPTIAHAVTKLVAKDFREGGVKLADVRIVQHAAALFDTEDLQSAVESFLADGPGKASFSGH